MFSRGRGGFCVVEGRVGFGRAGVGGGWEEVGYLCFRRFVGGGLEVMGIFEFLFFFIVRVGRGRIFRRRVLGY